MPLDGLLASGAHTRAFGTRAQKLEFFVWSLTTLKWKQVSQFANCLTVPVSNTVFIMELLITNFLIEEYMLSIISFLTGLRITYRGSLEIFGQFSQWHNCTWDICCSVPDSAECTCNWKTRQRCTRDQAWDWGFLLLTHLPLDKMAAILADNIFKCIFLPENVRISNEISLKFVPKGSIDNKLALFQVMAWCRIGDKPLSEPMLTRFADSYMWH